MQVTWTQNSTHAHTTVQQASRRLSQKQGDSCTTINKNPQDKAPPHYDVTPLNEHWTHQNQTGALMTQSKQKEHSEDQTRALSECARAPSLQDHKTKDIQRQIQCTRAPKTASAAKDLSTIIPYYPLLSHVIPRKREKSKPTVLNCAVGAVKRVESIVGS